MFLISFSHHFSTELEILVAETNLLTASQNQIVSIIPQNFKLDPVPTKSKDKPGDAVENGDKEKDTILSTS